MMILIITIFLSALERDCYVYCYFLLYFLNMCFLLYVTQEIRIGTRGSSGTSTGEKLLLSINFCGTADVPAYQTKLTGSYFHECPYCASCMMHLFVHDGNELYRREMLFKNQTHL